MAFYRITEALTGGILILMAASISQADTVDVVQRLNDRGHVLMIRHALAPGTGDPHHFQIDDCRTQRNLSARGRTQAKAIGQWLRARGVETADLFSSQWCRCLETAKLMALGQVTPLPALNSFFERPEERESRLADLRKFIAELPPDAGLVIMVTHFVTIASITGEGVSSGEGILLEIREDRVPQVVGRLGFDAK